MSFKQPGIFYEENENGISNGIPFMEIENEKVPKVLFIGAVRDTDELVENDSSETVKEIIMQSYYNSEALKEVLDEKTYISVKKQLGLIK